MLITERIQHSADALGAISVLTEQKFLAIGDRVERAVAVLAHLAATFATLLGQMRSDTVMQAKQKLALAAAEAARLAEVPASDAAALKRLTHMTEAINSRIIAMRQIAGDVDNLAINARIISAGMGDAGVDFLGFAAEIHRSAALVQTNLARIGSELTSAGRQLEVARRGVVTFVERHDTTLRAIPKRLAAAVVTIEAHDELAAAAATAVATRTADIHRQVGAMIVELQIGDITRQRIEHMQGVAAALLCLASPASVSQSEWQKLPPGDIAALLQAGCNLAAAQLHDAASELDEDAGRVAQNLSQLAVDARDISSLGEQAYGAADQHHHSFMVELEASLHATEALFEGLHSARDEAEQRIASVLGIAHRLTENIGTLRGLEVDIRIMGLNTTLKCGRLGTLGRPLSVIAQELRDCGSRTANHADAALAALKLLADLADTMNATHRASGGAAGGSGTQGLLGVVDLLSRTGRTLSDALAGLDHDSAAAAELLQAAMQDFSVRHDVGEILQTTAGELSGIAAEQVGQTVTDPASIGRLLERFATVYTMARERDVHARFGGPVCQQPDPVAGADLADVLF